METQVMVHPYNGLSLSNKKEQTRHITGLNPQNHHEQNRQTQKSTYWVIHLSEILELSTVDDFMLPGDI